jgi:hypothetical protein
LTNVLAIFGSLLTNELSRSFIAYFARSAALSDGG